MLFCFACADTPPAPTPEPPSAETSSIFSEEAAARGLDFTHHNGMFGELTIAEVMGSGVGLLDYDNDGDLDVYLVQGGPLHEIATVDYLGDFLFRNDLEKGELSFTDVSQESGVGAAAGYGMGVATGDVDNDGWVDLYVTELGPNRLLRNRGDGTFEVARGVAQDVSWSVSAEFMDFDGDGWLDLYVVNYVDFSLAGNKKCKSLTGAPDYCGPVSYRPQSDSLWRNRGDGSFESFTQKAGLDAESAAGLGVVSGDFDGDGRMDFYVANDGMPNHLWRQQGDGTFRNEALLRGCALSREGMAEAGMGVVAGDVDGDGDEDLLVTHLALETNTLYRNDGSGFFEDATIPSGLGTPSYTATGFGTAFFDFDLDGWLDLMAVNGAVKIIPELVAAGDDYPLHMPNLLFANRGDGRFEDVSARAGLARSEVSRGLATGDLDNDGDVDVVISNNNGPARLLLNQLAGGTNWIGVRLVDAAGRDAYGARVGVEREGAATLWRTVRTGGSYLSASDPRRVVGLGEALLSGVVVKWPSGGRERFAVESGAHVTLREGTGAADG